MLIDTEPKELNKWATANNLLENNQREKIFTDNNQFQLYSIMIRKIDFISGERLLQSFPYLLLDPECVEKLRKKTLILAERAHYYFKGTKSDHSILSWQKRIINYLEEQKRLPFPLFRLYPEWMRIYEGNQYLVFQSARGEHFQLPLYLTEELAYLSGVIVTLPKNISQEEIDKIVLQKAPWILDKLHEFGEVILKPSDNEFVSGEKYLYLGRGYRLKVLKREDIIKPSLVFYRGKFFVNINNNITEEEQIQIVRDQILKWYIEKAELFLKERVSILSEKTGIQPQGMKIREQQKRWGSCTKDNILIFNWLIIMAPVSVIDYIIIHELCHLKYPNHSENFWKEVAVFCPDFQKRRDWLRIRGPELSF